MRVGSSAHDAIDSRWKIVQNRSNEIAGIRGPMQVDSEFRKTRGVHQFDRFSGFRNSVGAFQGTGPSLIARVLNVPQTKQHSRRISRGTHRVFTKCELAKHGKRTDPATIHLAIPPIG
jgi:hypothetical protein